MPAGKMTLGSFSRRQHRFFRRKKKNRLNNRGRPLVNPRGRLVRGKITNSLSIIPDEQPVIFKYYQSFTLTTGAAPVAKIFYGNAPNDPDFSSPGVGTRPNGYNEMSALFDRLYCTSSKLILRVANPNAEPIRIAINPTNTPLTTPASMDNIVSRPRTVYRLLDNNEGVRKLQNSATTRAITGQPFDASDDSLLMVSIPTPPTTPPEANPINQWFYNIVAQAHNGTTAIALACEVEIYYQCMLYDRANLLQSSVGGSA